MKKFLPGQTVSYRGQLGLVEAVDLTPGMVDVKYGRLVKRHRGQDLEVVHVARNNGRDSDRRPRRERLERGGAPRSRARANPADSASEAALATLHGTKGRLEQTVTKDLALLARWKGEALSLAAETKIPAALAEDVVDRLITHQIPKAPSQSEAAVAADELMSSAKGKRSQQTLNAFVDILGSISTARNLIEYGIKELKGVDSALAGGGEAALLYIQKTATRAKTVSEKMALKQKKPRPTAPIRHGEGPGPGSQFFTAAAFVGTVKEGATWLALPDPPRYVEKTGVLQPEICGNPIDGVMYVLVVKGQKRYSPVTVTDAIWSEALASWMRGKKNSKEEISVIEVLTSWAKGKPKNWGLPKVFGDGWAEGSVVPFSREDVERIKRGIRYSSEEGPRTVERTLRRTDGREDVEKIQKAVQVERRYRALLAKEILDATEPAEPKLKDYAPSDLANVIVERLVGMQVVPSTAPEALRELAAYIESNIVAARRRGGAKRVRTALEARVRLAMQHEEEDAAREEMRTSRALYEAEQVQSIKGLSPEELEKFFQDMDRAGRGKEARERFQAAGKARQRSGVGKMRGGEMFVRQVDAATHFFETSPGSQLYVYYVFPRAASVNEEKLVESFTPPFNLDSGKRRNPFFTWNRMTRPLDISPVGNLVRSRGRVSLHAAPDGGVLEELPPQSKLTVLPGSDTDRWLQVKTSSGKMGWVRKSHVTYSKGGEFSRAPLCESAGNREIVEAAQKVKKRLYEMQSGLRWLRTTVEKALLDETYPEASLIRPGTSFLRSLAWFTSWCQDMLVTQEKTPAAISSTSDTPELVIFSAIRKEPRTRPDGLDVGLMVRLATLPPVPLVSPDASRLARIVGRIKERSEGGISFLDSATTVGGSTLPSFVAATFFDPKSVNRAPTDIVGKILQQIPAATGRSTGKSPSQALVSAIVRKLVAAGVEQEKDAPNLTTQLANLSEQLFFTPERDSEISRAISRKDEGILEPARLENRRLSILRALFFLYYSMGGLRTEKMLNLATLSINRILENAGRLPQATFVTVESEKMELEESLKSAKEGREKLQASIDRLAAESRMSQVGSRFTRLGADVSVFYTFNPLLFSVTKEMWGTESPWKVDPGHTVPQDTLVRLRDIDVIGRYGYALKLFYEHGMSKNMLEDVTQSLASAVGADSFKAWLGEKRVSGIDWRSIGKEVETTYPVLSRLEPGFGGSESFTPYNTRVSGRVASGEDLAQGGWLDDSQYPDFAPEAEKFTREPGRYLSDLRAQSFESMSRQRSLLHTAHPGRTPLRPLAISEVPPYQRTPAIGEKAEVSTHLPPGSAVAALEDLESDFHALRTDIERRRQELLVQTRTKKNPRS